MDFNKIRRGLIYSFVFLGPIGSLVPVWPNMYSFRFFYCIIPIGMIFFLVTLKKSSLFTKRLMILSPFMVYIMFSAITVEVLYDFPFNDPNNPILRVVLFMSLLIFTMLMVDEIEKFSEVQKMKLIFMYVTGYFVSLISGYIMYAGFYQGYFTLENISAYHVLLQQNYGFIRFSPGSYPNEYGIISSFTLSILTLFALRKKEIRGMLNSYILSKTFLLCLWSLTLLALLLSTTRAAYISYILSVIYISFLSKKLMLKLRSFLMIAISILFVIYFLQIYVYDVWNVFIAGYGSFFDRTASAYERFIAWENTKQEFFNHWILGIGFGMSHGIHNVYLQCVFENGLIGTLILSFILMLFRFYEKRRRGFPEKKIFLNIRDIGLIHILWFACSNHNLNHHLTWFSILLCYMCWKSKRNKNVAK